MVWDGFGCGRQCFILGAMSRLFAQATILPNNGASNASDFQPLTRNPQQNPVNTQQQQGNLQNPTTQEVLGRSDLNITVPITTPAQATADPFVDEPGSMNWFPLIVLVVVIVCGTAYFISKQHKKRKQRTSAPVSTEPQEVLLVPEEDDEVATEEPVPRESKPEPSAAKTPAKKKPKKSKSKRKHK
jgi:hypothetical protein